MLATGVRGSDVSCSTIPIGWLLRVIFHVITRDSCQDMFLAPLRAVNLL